jgi:hypothetical protein
MADLGLRRISCHGHCREGLTGPSRLTLAAVEGRRWQTPEGQRAGESETGSTNATPVLLTGGAGFIGSRPRAASKSAVPACVPAAERFRLLQHWLPNEKFRLGPHVGDLARVVSAVLVRLDSFAQHSCSDSRRHLRDAPSNDALHAF